MKVQDFRFSLAINDKLLRRKNLFDSSSLWSLNKGGVPTVILESSL